MSSVRRSSITLNCNHPPLPHGGGHNNNRESSSSAIVAPVTSDISTCAQSKSTANENQTTDGNKRDGSGTTSHLPWMENQKVHLDDDCGNREHPQLHPLLLFPDAAVGDSSGISEQHSDLWEEELNELEQFHNDSAVAVAMNHPFTTAATATATIFQEEKQKHYLRKKDIPTQQKPAPQPPPTDQLFQLAMLGSWSEFIEHCQLYPQDAQWRTPLLPLFAHDDNHISKKRKADSLSTAQPQLNHKHQQEENYGTILHFLLQLCHDRTGGRSGGGIGDDDDDYTTTQTDTTIHCYHTTNTILPTPPYNAFEVLIKAYPSAVVMQSSLWKRTPLHDAIESNSVSRPIFRLLLETSNQYIPPSLSELQSLLALSIKTPTPTGTTTTTTTTTRQQGQSQESPCSSSLPSSLLPQLPMEVIQDYIYPYSNMEPLEIQDWKGNAPLHLFFKKSRETYGSQKLLRDLIDECPRALRLYNHEGRTPLHQAIVSNASPYQFEILIDAYPRVLLLLTTLPPPSSSSVNKANIPAISATNINKSTNNKDRRKRGQTPLHYYLQHHIIQGRHYTTTTRGETLHILRLLAGTCPEVLTMKNCDEKTPLQLLNDYNDFDGFVMNRGRHRIDDNDLDDSDDSEAGIIQDCIALLERLSTETTQPCTP